MTGFRAPLPGQGPPGPRAPPPGPRAPGPRAPGPPDQALSGPLHQGPPIQGPVGPNKDQPAPGQGPFGGPLWTKGRPWTKGPRGPSRLDSRTSPHPGQQPLRPSDQGPLGQAPALRAKGPAGPRPGPGQGPCQGPRTLPGLLAARPWPGKALSRQGPWLGKALVTRQGPWPGKALGLGPLARQGLGPTQDSADAQTPLPRAPPNQGSAKPPRGAKSHQKASKASKGPLKEGGPQDLSVPTMKNAIFEY